MDVKTTFLYGLIDQLVYMQIPKGWKSFSTREMVCKLLKALYGLKKAPRLCYKRFSNFLLKKLVSTLVDDIKVIGVKDSSMIKRLKQELTAAFEMINMDQSAFTWASKLIEIAKRRPSNSLNRPTSTRSWQNFILIRQKPQIHQCERVY